MQNKGQYFIKTKGVFPFIHHRHCAVCVCGRVYVCVYVGVCVCVYETDGCPNGAGLFASKG